jgi:hypothetical protein
MDQGDASRAANFCREKSDSLGSKRVWPMKISESHFKNWPRDFYYGLQAKASKWAASIAKS